MEIDGFELAAKNVECQRIVKYQLYGLRVDVSYALHHILLSSSRPIRNFYFVQSCYKLQENDIPLISKENFIDFSREFALMFDRSIIALLSIVWTVSLVFVYVSAIYGVISC